MTAVLNPKAPPADRYSGDMSTTTITPVEVARRTHPLVWLRVAVFVSMAYLALREYPEDLHSNIAKGTGWGLQILSHFPTGRWLLLARAALVGLCGFAVAGRRWAMGSATLLAVYVLGMPQLDGKVDHYHHLVWFAAILALTKPGMEWSARRAILVLFGCVYLFPGIAKLTSPYWFHVENLQGIVNLQRGVAGLSPLELPSWILWGLIFATVAFEVGFAFLVWVDRRAAAIVGLGFHVGSFVLLGIFFWQLAVCYVVLLPHHEDERRPPSVPLVAVAAALVLGAVVTGLIGWENDWPMAAYPFFSFKFT